MKKNMCTFFVLLSVLAMILTACGPNLSMGDIVEALPGAGTIQFSLNNQSAFNCSPNAGERFEVINTDSFGKASLMSKVWEIRSLDRPSDVYDQSGHLIAPACTGWITNTQYYKKINK